jgi:hypothetical protein
MAHLRTGLLFTALAVAIGAEVLRAAAHAVIDRLGEGA